ncbi:hypothetical protein P43SY_009153 [Pythium insidiosum]|uniref:Thiamine phosphate synthase/TenI domain-containing protein n=1 Tax=Pythium insidiosum TaxID=114742 RepID=A0AAD5M5R1_PYTIN|nr:hypothetical protein P43SY_009153 [Pythium insidiosum]
MAASLIASCRRAARHPQEGRRWLELIVHPRDVAVAASSTRHAIAGAVATHAVDVLQLRATFGDSDDDVRKAAEELHRLLSKGSSSCRLVVNHPSLDVVAGLGACDGWHLKEHVMLALVGDGTLSDVLHHAREKLGSESLLGCSVHSVDSALAAMRGSGFDYLQVGTMFSTPSHPEKRFSHQLEGPTLITAIREAALASGARHVPAMIAVGGVNTVEHIAQVLDADADGVAMIRGLLGARDPPMAARQYRACLDERRCRVPPHAT